MWKVLIFFIKFKSVYIVYVWDLSSYTRKAFQDLMTIKHWETQVSASFKLHPQQLWINIKKPTHAENTTLTDCTHEWRDYRVSYAWMVNSLKLTKSLLAPLSPQSIYIYWERTEAALCRCCLSPLSRKLCVVCVFAGGVWSRLCTTGWTLTEKKKGWVNLSVNSSPPFTSSAFHPAST